MSKKISALFLMFVLAITMSVNVFAADLTLEDKINAMTLSPIQTSEWPDDYIDIYDDAPAGVTNYQKLRSVYDEWATESVDGVNCVGYACALQTAWEVIGVRTYHIRGEVSTTNGGWTAHSWVGVVIDGQMYYFDSNLPGKYGASGNYFGVLPKDATYYRSAQIMQLYVSPEVPIYFSGGTCAIDDENRSDYKLVPVDHDYMPSGGGSGLAGVDNLG